MNFKKIILNQWVSKETKGLFVSIILFLISSFLLLRALQFAGYVDPTILEMPPSWDSMKPFVLVAMSAVCLSVAASASHSSGGTGVVEFNFSVPSQRKMIAQTIRACRDELVIYSGQFRSTIYDCDEVYEALSSLENQAVKLSCRDEDIDPASIRFIGLCKERNWKVKKGLLSKQAHFIIVDGIDCRIEFPSHNDDGDQFAVYYSGRPDFCTRLIRSLKNNVALKGSKSDMQKEPGG